MLDETLRQVKELHAPDPFVGKWCGVCIEAGSMDSERQVWPCETAELLYTPGEIEDIFALRHDAEHAARMEIITAERARVNELRRTDPDAFWALVEQCSKSREPSLIERIWSKEINFLSVPILRYSKFAHKDGSVDEHLQTGRYAE